MQLSDVAASGFFMRMVPEKHVDLPEMALRNPVLFWLLPVDGISDRDAEALIDLRNRNINEPAEAMEND